MAKRLTFDVDDALHSRLKAEAAALGISLGAHCSSILASGGVTGTPAPIEEIDPAVVYNLPLSTLREMSSALSATQPKDWKKGINIINNEIKRRYRT